MENIGWRHAEPVLRSLLAYALLAHEGSNPANRDGEPDRPERMNRELTGMRDRYLAASVFNLRGSGDQENPLVGRIRAALS